jgi:hypothetical protein
MSNYQIVCLHNPSPSTTPVFYQPGFFFNEPEHLSQQRDSVYSLIVAINRQTGQSEARCAFFSESNKVISPAAAPFGSIEFIDTLPDSILGQMISLLIAEAKSTGATVLQLVHYPSCYAPIQTNRLSRKLIDHEFQISRIDQSQYLPITNEPFENQIAPSERRRLRKCREANFQFSCWSSPQPDTLLTFIQNVHQHKGYLPTISYLYLHSLLRTFPDHFSIFTVRNGTDIIALTITVRVRNDILYTFLPVSDPNYNPFSPMVMLTDGLFTYCRQQGVRLLDLGVSLDNNRQPKPSLIRFKQNLGAQESVKLVFDKRL